MRKKVGIIKKYLVILLIIAMSINSFGAVVSDNDGSAFITKAEFDALKSSYQFQIDSYNNSIDSKIDGAIASYLAGIQLSTSDELTPLINSINYANVRWKYSQYYESPQVPFNGVWSCTYFRQGPANTALPVDGKNMGGTVNTAQNKIPQYVDGAISGTSINATKMVKLKQSTGAAYDGKFTFAGTYPNGGFRAYDNLFCMPVYSHAWTTFATGTGKLPLPASNIDMLEAYDYEEPIWGYPSKDSFIIDWITFTASAGNTIMRVTKDGVRMDLNPYSEWNWPGSGGTTGITGVGDSYAYRKIIMYGYDPVTNTVNYAASVGSSQAGNTRIADLKFNSTSDDIIAGNVKYPPTELIITNTSDPGYPMMEWSSTPKPLTDFLDITGYGYILRIQTDTAGKIGTWSNTQWSAFPANCINGPSPQAAFYGQGTTTVTGWGNYGQSNYLIVENLWYQQDTLPLYQRLYFDSSDMTSVNTELNTNLNSKGIYNGVPLCISPKDGRIKLTIPIKDDLLSGSRSQIKLWITKGPIENDGDLTKTSTGTGFVSNKYTIIGATNADKSIQVNPGTGTATATLQFEVAKNDIVYLHAIPVSNQAGQEVVANIENTKIEIIYAN